MKAILTSLMSFLRVEKRQEFSLMPRLAKVRREQNAKKMEWFLARIAPAKRRNRERERELKKVFASNLTKTELR
jgi:hypothetical protein